MKKRVLFLAVVFAALAGIMLVERAFAADAFPLETIIYRVSSGGTAEYKDYGIVDFEGGKAKFISFSSEVFGFEDLEEIYADPKTLLPLRVNRHILFLIGGESLVEEYAPASSTLVIKKYARGKVVKEYRFSADNPIQNAILLPFSLRNIPAPDIGWSFSAFLPAEFKFTLVSIDEVKVPAGRFKAYHFVSEPHKFQIWISQDNDRLPVKIMGAGGYKYTMTMRKRILRER